MSERIKNMRHIKVKSSVDRPSEANGDAVMAFESPKRSSYAISEPLISDVPRTNHKFADLPIADPIKKGLTDMGITDMTEIQWKCIPHLLEWKDVMATAKTGSGKTLAFLIPVVERILQLGMRWHEGIGAIIISPTRELSLQIHSVLKKLTAYTQVHIGLIMGGNNRRIEAKNFEKGVAILVATPGRLIDHINNTKYFFLHNLKVLVIDEADRLLDTGFELQMEEIIRRLPKNRQSVLFSATLNEKTHKLAQSALRAGCVMVGVQEQSEATIETLEHGYYICDPATKFSLLYTFLKHKKNTKVVVFMSACLEVDFYYDLLNFVDMPVQAIHGHQKQAKRTSTFMSFVKAQNAVLLCTDVGARGLDIPEVDWIVQFDPPDSPKDYIHRVGRTARAGKSGNAVLMLRPHELGFLEVLRNSKVNPVEYEVEAGKIANIQPALEKLISSIKPLALSARKAFVSIVRSYNAYKLVCFNVNELDLVALAKTCGLHTVPRVDLGVQPSKKLDPKRMKRKAFANAAAESAKKTKSY